MKKYFLRYLFLIFVVFCSFQPQPVHAWSEHPMLIYPILKSMPGISGLPDVEVKSLRQFLIEEEAGLAGFLADHEQWAREHIRNYAPRPETLDFQFTGNPDDIQLRFFSALRINPHVKMALYLHLLPGDDPGERELAEAGTLTTLSNIYEMLFTTYVRVSEGEMLAPLSVLATATDEPDYGFDLGLFEDNETEWGISYGFGQQPFGNPDLEYSSQAPFHMGFYHESWMVFAAAPFLKRTYVEYRIHLYKSLATYAFNAGQDYWGWRFLGWATHYLNDMSMPYHTSVMPARGPLGMMWINIKAMLGFPRAYNNAVQLLSNRHTVYEHFQWIVLKEAHTSGNNQHPFIQALLDPVGHISYDDDFARKVAARESARLARKHDRKLRKLVPSFLVSDPGHEIKSSSELEGLDQLIREEKGDKAVDELSDLMAERFRSLSMHTRSFVSSVARIPVE